MFCEGLAANLKESGLHVVVTGGSSWLGQASLAVLENALGGETSTRVRVFGSRARPLRLPSGGTIESRDLSDISSLPAGRYLFLHYAFITKGHVAEQPLPDYIRLNREIADVVETAARRVQAEGFFLPSSGAVYRKDRTLHDRVDENPYGVMKLDDERRFRNMSETIGCRFVPVRVFNVGGPWINNAEAFALGSIIMAVLRGDPVRLKANNQVFRSYVHVVDLVELVLTRLLSESWKSCEPCDTAGEVVVEVGELARRITEAMGVPDHPIERPEIGVEPVDYYVGDGTQFVNSASLLGVALKPLSVQIDDTVADLTGRFSALSQRALNR